ISCPCCGGRLKIIGSRNRKAIERSGEVKVYNIRRMRCVSCDRIHHELPDFLVPYKRYESECIEAVLTNPSQHDVAADESTIYRWFDWYRYYADYWLGCLVSIMIRTKEKTPLNFMSENSKSAPLKIGHLVGDAPRWLDRIVRPIVNMNLWIHTRSAFLSSAE